MHSGSVFFLTKIESAQRIKWHSLNSKHWQIIGVMTKKTRGLLNVPIPSLICMGEGSPKIYMEMENKFEPSVHADTFQ